MTSQDFSQIISRKHSALIASPTVETANDLYDAAATIMELTFAVDAKMSARAESMMWTAIRLGAAR